MRLTGDRNQCPSCGLHFNSTAAFGKHRTGSFTGFQRRCLTESEMLAKGMGKSKSGFWVGAPMANAGAQYWSKTPSEGVTGTQVSPAA